MGGYAYRIQPQKVSRARANLFPLLTAIQNGDSAKPIGMGAAALRALGRHYAKGFQDAVPLPCGVVSVALCHCERVRGTRPLGELRKRQKTSG